MTTRPPERSSGAGRSIALLRSSARQILRGMRLFGIDLPKTVRALSALPWYFRDLRTLAAQLKDSSLPFHIGGYQPCLTDKHSTGGAGKGGYFFGDLLVAQRIFANQPKLHVDIGSRVDGFVTHVATFRTIEILDIRPIESRVPNIKFRRGDLMADLDSSLVDYCDSLSCLHALEHFGLGRYGDPICADGHIKGFDNFHRILQRGGKLYLSVPMGPQRIVFNAHRVFAMDYLLGLIGDKYRIDSFSYVNDNGDLFADVELSPERTRANFSCRTGLAIFELTKL